MVLKNSTSLSYSNEDGDRIGIDGEGQWRQWKDSIAAESEMNDTLQQKGCLVSLKCCCHLLTLRRKMLECEIFYNTLPECNFTLDYFFQHGGRKYCCITMIFLRFVCRSPILTSFRPIIINTIYYHTIDTITKPSHFPVSVYNNIYINFCQ